MRVIMMSHLVRQIIGYSSLLATFFVDPHARTAGANFHHTAWFHRPQIDSAYATDLQPGSGKS